MLIQILLSLFIFFALIKIFGRYRSKEINASFVLFWCLFWLAVAVVVWHPEFSTNLANRLGVGRGSDLVLYVSVAVIFYLIFRLSVKLERTERNITKIVTALALKKGEDDQVNKG